MLAHHAPEIRVSHSFLSNYTKILAEISLDNDMRSVKKISMNPRGLVFFVRSQECSNAERPRRHVYHTILRYVLDQMQREVATFKTRFGDWAIRLYMRLRMNDWWWWW